MTEEYMMIIVSDYHYDQMMSLYYVDYSLVIIITMLLFMITFYSDV